MLRWQRYDSVPVSASKERMNNTQAAFLHKYGSLEQDDLVTQLTAAGGMCPSLRKPLTVLSPTVPGTVPSFPQVGRLESSTPLRYPCELPSGLCRPESGGKKKSV